MRLPMPRLAAFMIAGFALSLVILSGAPSRGDVTPDQADYFESKIRPVLSEQCLKCHGPAKQASELRLDSREAILAGGVSGPAAVEGKPEESLLIAAVRRTHEDIKMPPKSKLPDEAVASLTRWVAMGMPWPSKASVKATGSASDDPMKSHWAFQRVGTVEVPQPRDAGRVQTPVDAFIQDRLDQEGLTPSPEADRRTLIRRLTFDLLGLPPTPEEVAAFESDLHPDAYERLVERLLASPQYGERWARHWLDVARYSDTKGYVFQEERRYPFAYTYRDYVTRAFNEDKPYDQFVVEQLAADRLGPDHDPASLAALGFLTLGRRFLNSREDIIDDRIDVMCRGLLGLTVSCARCHDHKFDPIPSEDYYSLFGVFASTVEPAVGPEIPAPVPPELREQFQKQLAVKEKALDDFQAKKLGEIQADLIAHAPGYLRAAVEIEFNGRSPKLDERAKANGVNSGRLRGVAMRWKAKLDAARGKPDPVFAAWHAFGEVEGAEFSRRAPSIGKSLAADDPKVCNSVLAGSFAERPPGSMAEVAARYGELLAESEKQWVEAQKQGAKTLADPSWEAIRQLVHGAEGPLAITPDNLSRALDRAERNTFNSLNSAVAAVRASHPGSPPRAMVLNDSPNPVEPRVFLRGNPGRPGKIVPRRALAIIAPVDRQPFQDGSGRLELARAIAAPTNPLTARVFVNRVWLQHFGAALVSTPSDFGTRSDPPTHPELLDWLAADFMNHGWSVKHLHQRIVLSATYRQRGDNRPECLAKDPENRLVWKANRRRLEFEAMRDALLFVSGSLDQAIGGRPVTIAEPPYTPRRTLYGFIDRQNLDGVYRTFDFASPDASSPRRFATMVPQQALFLMNSPFVIDQAEKLAASGDPATASPEAHVERLYRRLFGRAPTEFERAAGVRYLATPESSGATESWQALKQKLPGAKPGLSRLGAYAQALLMTNEFMFVD